MPEFIRVKDRETKHEYTIVASTFDEKAHELLKKDAVHTDGTALPPKHYESLSSKKADATPASAQSGQSADSSKENS